MATGRLLLSIRRTDSKKLLGNNQAHQYKPMRPTDLLDMTRVTSDALPHSLNATTVHLEREETPDFKNSAIIEVLSSPDEPTENKIDQSLGAESIATQPSTQCNTKNARPLSAPTKTVASIVSVPAHKSHTLPNKRNSLFKQAKDRQTAEREKRTASIHNNAQILLKYAQNRQSSHSSSSLQIDNQSPTRINKLFESAIDQQKSVEDSESPDLSCSRHSSSSITMEECSSSSTPLNLRHISMDETRLASVMQMDSIWKQVESGDDSPSLTAKHSGSLLFDKDEDEFLDLNDQTEPSEDFANEVLVSSGISALNPSSLPFEESTVTLTTSVTPNLLTSTPVISSTPVPICTPTPSSMALTTPTPITASTPLTQSVPLSDDISAPTELNVETRQQTTSLDNKGTYVHNYTCMYMYLVHAFSAVFRYRLFTYHFKITGPC